MSLEDDPNCKPIRNKNGIIVAYGCVVPKEDMGKFEILLETEDDQFRFDSPAKFSKTLRDNSKTIPLPEIIKTISFVSSRLRVLKRKQKGANVKFGSLGSGYSSEDEV